MFQFRRQQSLAEHIESIRAYEDGNGVAFLIAHRNGNGNNQSIRRNRAPIHFRDVGSLFAGPSFIPITVRKVLAKQSRLRRIDRAHRARKIVDAKKGTVRAKRSGTLQMPCNQIQISFGPGFGEGSPRGNRFKKGCALPKMFVH